MAVDEADEMIGTMKKQAAYWHGRMKEPDLKRQLEQGVVELDPLVKELMRMYPEEKAGKGEKSFNEEEKCGGEGGTPGPCPENKPEESSPKNPKGSKKEGGAKFPKVGSNVTVDGARYVVEPLDGDDTFPPAIASYEIKDGYVLYTARNGGEGIVSGSPKELAKWMLDVRKELQATPTADTTPRPWKPEDGGKENLKAAEDTVAKTAAAFGIATPKVTHAVAVRPLESGSHSPGHVTLQNSYQRTPNSSLNFDTGTSYENHIAAHETMHSVFSDKTDISRKYMEELSRSKDKVSVYHALAGNFEGLMDLGAAYIHSPEQLKRYSPELFDIADRWAAETRGTTNGKGFQSSNVKGSPVLRNNANAGGNSGIRSGGAKGLLNVGLSGEVRRDGKGRTKDGNLRELDNPTKCGGEGGTPGPCPENEGAKPAAGKKPHLNTVNGVLAAARAGTMTTDDLEAFGASLRKLPPTKLAQVAVAVGLPKTAERFEIVDRVNELRGEGIRAGRASGGSETAPEPKRKPTPPSPERTRENASTVASAFDKLDTNGRNFVNLADLKERFPDMSKEDFTAAVNHLRREGGFTASAAEGRHGVSERELSAAIRDDLGDGKNQLMLYLSRKAAKKRKKR